MSTLGKNMKHLREYHDHTQKFAGGLLGVVQSEYSRYEKGLIQPSDEQVAKFAAYYKVPVELLKSGGEFTLHMPNANGTQVANGQHVNQQQHVVSEEFVKEVLERNTAMMREQNATTMKDVQELVRVVALTNDRVVQLMELLIKQQPRG